MKRILIIAIIFFLAGKINAQMENIPLVTVTGEAVSKVVPDEVILGVKIIKSMAVSQLETLKVFNLFNSENTQIKFIGSDNIEIKESLVLVSYSKQVDLVKEVYITIDDLAKYPRILLKLYNLGFKDVSIIDIRSTKLKDYKYEAYIEAVENAREKATLLASSLGQSIGIAHAIEDIEQPIINWYAEYVQVPYDSGNTEAVDMYIQNPGTINVAVKVKVSFELNK